MKKTLLILTILSIFLYVSLKTSSAQSIKNNVILTWRVKNFYPSSFTGKALPTPGSKVYVSLNIVSQKKIIGLNNYKISWYLDKNFIKSGVGLDEFSFIVKENQAGKHTIRVKIKNGLIDYSINIPIVKPEVIIEIPYYRKKILQNKIIKIKVIPYFFNNLSMNKFLFMWKIGNKIEKNVGKNSISIDVGSKKTLYITSSVQNQDNKLEYMNKTIKLYVQ